MNGSTISIAFLGAKCAGASVLHILYYERLIFCLKLTYDLYILEETIFIFF